MGDLGSGAAENPCTLTVWFVGKFSIKKTSAFEVLFRRLLCETAKEDHLVEMPVYQY